MPPTLLLVFLEPTISFESILNAVGATAQFGGYGVLCVVSLLFVVAVVYARSSLLLLRVLQAL